MSLPFLRRHFSRSGTDSSWRTVRLSDKLSLLHEGGAVKGEPVSLLAPPA
jgi:hypothetical protein